MAYNPFLDEEVRKKAALAGQTASLPEKPTLPQSTRGETVAPVARSNETNPFLAGDIKRTVPFQPARLQTNPFLQGGVPQTPPQEEGLSPAGGLAKAIGEATVGSLLNLGTAGYEALTPKEDYGTKRKILGMDVKAPETPLEWIGNVGDAALTVGSFFVPQLGLPAKEWLASKGIIKAAKSEKIAAEALKAAQLAEDTIKAEKAAKFKAATTALTADRDNLAIAEAGAKALEETAKVTKGAVGLTPEDALSPAVVKEAQRASLIGNIKKDAATFGAYSGFGAMRENKSTPEIVADTLSGTLLGALTPVAFAAAGKVVRLPYTILTDTKLGKKVVEKIYDTNIYRKFVGTSLNVLSKMGAHGEAAASLLRYADSQAEQRAARLISLVISSTRGLTKEELSLFSKAVESGLEPNKFSKEMAKALKVWREISSQFAVDAQELALEIIGLDGKKHPWIPRPNFFPKVVNPKMLLEKDGIERAKNWLMRTGQAESPVDAEQKLLRFIMRQRDRAAGSLEHARSEIGLPPEFYLTDPIEIMAKYIKDSTRRVTQVRILGKGDARINALISAIGRVKDGTTLADAKLANAIVNRILGREETSIFADEFRKLRAFNTFTKLGLFALSNISQTVNTATLTGIRNTMKGLVRSFTREGKDFAMRSAATLDTTLQTLLDETASRTYGKQLEALTPIDAMKLRKKLLDEMTLEEWMRMFFKVTGGNGTEYFNRNVAANSARSYILELQARFLSNPKDALAIRKLREFGISIKPGDRNSILVNPIKPGPAGVHDKRLLEAANRVTRATQFRTAPADMPLWWTSPEGRLVTQFKAFAYQHAKFIKNQVFAEAARGNWRPLFRYAALGVAMGEASQDLKALARGDKSRFKKKDMERVIDNISAIGGVGIMGDALKSSMGGSFSSARFIGGPTLSSAADFMGGIGDAIEGNPRNLEKAALYHIPVVGPLLSNTVFPKKR